MSGDTTAARRNAQVALTGAILARARRVETETLALAKAQRIHLARAQVRAEIHEIACETMLSLGLIKRRRPAAQHAAPKVRHTAAPKAHGRESRRQHRAATQRKRQEQPAGGDEPPGEPALAFIGLGRDAKGATARYTHGGLPLTAFAIKDAQVVEVTYDAPSTRRVPYEMWEAIEADLVRRAVKR